MHIPQDGWCASARAQVQMFPNVPYRGNGYTDCAEIWCAVRNKLTMHFTLLRGGVHLYVRTLFRTSGTLGRIALKFGVVRDQ